MKKEFGTQYKGVAKSSFPARKEGESTLYPFQKSWPYYRFMTAHSDGDTIPRNCLSSYMNLSFENYKLLDGAELLSFHIIYCAIISSTIPFISVWFQARYLINLRFYLRQELGPWHVILEDGLNNIGDIIFGCAPQWDFLHLEVTLKVSSLHENTSHKAIWCNWGFNLHSCPSISTLAQGLVVSKQEAPSYQACIWNSSLYQTVHTILRGLICYVQVLFLSAYSCRYDFNITHLIFHCF